ncbi:c-type cytochrome [Paraburkholderia bannensis]|uniref:c-type cytochrome n=1 Tax=Paraburkholderia bannensis TaxID=765414 RepID=UPI002AB05268|nr:c-type cytochrome [Paraburkholderia bannensis]
MSPTSLTVATGPATLPLPSRSTLILIHAIATCAIAFHGSTVHAQLPEPTELVDQQHCMFCHTADAPFLAPSFHQIAQRYRDKPDAPLMLEDKLRHGGKAHWGDMAMPLPADRGGPLSAEDAHTLIRWVLSQ